MLLGCNSARVGSCVPTFGTAYASHLQKSRCPRRMLANRSIRITLGMAWTVIGSSGGKWANQVSGAWTWHQGERTDWREWYITVTVDVGSKKNRNVGPRENLSAGKEWKEVQNGGKQSKRGWMKKQGAGMGCTRVKEQNEGTKIGKLFRLLPFCSGALKGPT